MVILLELLLIGLRFVFVLFIYLFLWHILRLMYLELGSGDCRSKGGRLFLTVIKDKNGGLKKGEKYILGENTTIGRDSSNDLCINDSHVSAYHAVITRAGEKWQLRDLGSTNGTFVNKKLLTGPHNLRPGDIVVIGGVTFKVGWEDASRGHFPYRPGAAR
ncbi:MAG: FHA domain-containing protein [Clostridia bacterium]|nr:FHA domain-containing protein [Clostridia bacterium]